ncbi:hypothetical protein SK128_006916 [Halocaridina rubra]|uniref:L-serine ammonia-lyase n=1 Tax=Halocaridina rubra TaxID=373956 RepID=A0AAN9FWJ3_HALRR
MDCNKTDNAIHLVTPLIESDPLTRLCGRQVLLKLDNIQPSGSFKIRGISNAIQKSIRNGCKHIVSSSGGNAGMASAYAARKLGVKSTICIPESTPKMMKEKLEHEEAEVIVHGRNWNGAHEKATEIAKEKDGMLIHPFDHRDVWHLIFYSEGREDGHIQMRKSAREGHSTIISEILEQSPSKPSAIVVAVGGGGLLCGVFVGLHKHGITDIPVIAMETQGAHAYNAAYSARKPVSIGEITSLAKCLGALAVTPGVFDLQKSIEVYSHVVTDREAVHACAQFLDDHRMLTELACGAALAAAYSGILKAMISKKVIISDGPIIMVVCGGGVVTMQLLEDWQKQVGIYHNSV